MFQKISGNLNFDLFSEILLVFHEILQLTWYKTIGKKKQLSNSCKEKNFFTAANIKNF